MLSLHTVTEDTRVLFKWMTIGAALVILLFITFRVGGNVKEYFYPTPPPPPTVTFGQLPAIPFPVSVISTKFTYVLDTVTGTLPQLPDRATVYETQKKESNLLDLKNAQEKVKAIEFLGEGTRIGDMMYQWRNTENQTLTFNIVTSNFTLSSNFLADPSILASNELPDETKAKEQAERFLSNVQLFPNDIDRAKTKVTYLTVLDQKITAATSRSKANIAKVDFFQNNLEELPTYYPNPPESLMQILLTGGSFDSKIVEASFFHTPVSEVSATYPIVTADQAFEKLQNSQAYIASYFGTSNTIHITNVSLGYFLGNTSQAHVMPIIVFEGNDGFFAYVSAVTDAWTQPPSR